MSVRLGFVLFLVHSALCEDQLLKPCHSQDIDCLRQTTQTFLDKSSSGIPQFNIVPIDPMAIASIEVQVAPEKTVDLKEIAVTGLKNLRIDNFTMDLSTRSVALAMDAEANVQGHISVNDKDSTPFSGKIAGLQTAHYTYELIKNDKGVEFFKVGPVTIDCNLKQKPELNVSEVVSKALFSGNDDSDDEIKKKLACETFQIACGRVISNLRTIATLYPKNAFFTNL
ncbi:juvenile hormone-binding protein-like [Pectinophora gossypiella]|nr:juvenile hormone-binding protein-like [Pectinophora gossypiella]